MTQLTQYVLVVMAVLLAFFESSFSSLRHWLGFQFDLLPPLVACAALKGTYGFLLTIAFTGGLAFDTLSANPLGVSSLAFLVMGLVFYAKRDVILHGHPFAQSVAGGVAGFLAPLLCFGLLWISGRTPIAGWSSLLQWIEMAAVAGLAAPAIFYLSHRIDRLVTYPVSPSSAFRAEVEMKRDRG